MIRILKYIYILKKNALTEHKKNSLKINIQVFMNNCFPNWLLPVTLSLDIDLSILSYQILGRQSKYLFIFRIRICLCITEYFTLLYVNRTRKLDLFFPCRWWFVYTHIYSVSTERRNTCFPYFFSVRLAAAQWDGSSKVLCISLFCPGVWSLGSFETAAERRTCVCHWQKLMRYLKAVKLPHKIVDCSFSV